MLNEDVKEIKYSLDDIEYRLGQIYFALLCTCAIGGGVLGVLFTIAKLLGQIKGGN